MEHARLRSHVYGADDHVLAALAVALRRRTASLVMEWDSHVRAYLSATSGRVEAEVEAGFGDDGLLCNFEPKGEVVHHIELQLHPPPGAGHGEGSAHGDGVTTAQGARGAECSPCYRGCLRWTSGISLSASTELQQPPRAGYGEGEEETCVGVQYSEGEYGASDIFLIHRRKGSGYWIDALKCWVLSKLGLAESADDIPMEWSWVNMMGAPIYQSSETSFADDQGGDGSCVICSCMTCTHAQHRLAFERRHGAGSFPYELCQTDGVRMIKQYCLCYGIWKPRVGSEPTLVLEMMKRHPTKLTDVPGLFLSVRSYDKFSKEKLKPAGAMILLRLCGPMVGLLRAGPRYFISNIVPEYVYRGEPGGGPSNHAVVCVAYTFAPPGELLIQVLDNHSKRGPLRWILFDAFTSFTCIGVDPLTPEELPRPPTASLLSNIFFRKK